MTAIGKSTDALKGNGTDAARLDEAAKSLAAIRESIETIRSAADAHAAKLDATSRSLAALDTSVRQGFAQLSGPSKQLEAAVAAGTLHHGGNPVAEWMAEPAACHSG